MGALCLNKAQNPESMNDLKPQEGKRIMRSTYAND